MGFFIDKANFCRTNELIQKSLTQSLGNPIMPEGKPKNRQSSKIKTLELTMVSTVNFNFQISPIFRLL